MTNTTKRRIASVERYANALFQLAKEAKVLETVSSELTKLRNLMEQDKVIFVMDKPLSRNYPELFEENNELQIHTINTYSKKKKDVSKQNIFHTT